VCQLTRFWVLTIIDGMMPDVRVTRQQVREVDRRAIEELGIPGLILMENAGRTTTDYVRGALDAQGGSRVAVVGGTGNNGGDGWVVARHLHNAGVPVTMCLVGAEDRLSADAGVNYRIACKMGLPRCTVQSAGDLGTLEEMLGKADVVVDALLGTGSAGTVRPPVNLAIETVNACRNVTVVSLDIPSGLDCDTGQPGDPTIRADLTVTFVAKKVGFEAVSGRQYVGRVVVADIGAPPELISAVLGLT
jgi:NAD(P)H-hydrate epimerase